MLFPLIVHAARECEGLAPAAFFHAITGIGQTTFRRKSYGVLHGAKRGQVERHQEHWHLRSFIRSGGTLQEARRYFAAIPYGLCSQFVHSLGLFNVDLPSRLQDLAVELDQADIRLCRLADRREYDAFLRELGPGSRLGCRYSTPLPATGIALLPTECDPDAGDLTTLILTRRAHMALSLLASVDLEVGQAAARVRRSDPWSGRPRFACLLSDPSPSSARRIAPLDPYARLVDLVGATGCHTRDGHWPAVRPTLEQMGAQAEISGVIAGDGARFVRNLRSGKMKFTRIAYQRLLASQFVSLTSPWRTRLGDSTSLLGPHLLAAHMFAALMPPLTGKGGHRDLTGWRAAYMSWWRMHAEAGLNVPIDSADSPPDWLEGT